MVTPTYFSQGGGWREGEKEEGGRGVVLFSILSYEHHMNLARFCDLNLIVYTLTALHVDCQQGHSACYVRCKPPFCLDSRINHLTNHCVINM